MFVGTFASNIGTWMQTLVLPAYIDGRTKSGMWVGLFTFAQLGPLLLLSIPGGVLADKLPRRQWLMITQAAQLVLTLVIALLVANDAAVVALFGVQLVTGVANALSAPAMQGVVPNLVDPRDLPGAISLNSVMINGSRVVGPAIAAVLMARGMSAAGVFVVNAVTYLFVIYAITRIRIPVIATATTSKGWANFTKGLRIARQRSVLARLLVGMSLFSFFCLPFVGLFSTVTRVNLGLDPQRGAAYKWLYATWGFGACLGALAVGTVLARFDKARLIKPFMLGFAAFLAVFALLRSPVPAFPIGFALGVCYFALATSMLTVLQQNLRPHERARVMALWFMAFGGTVGIGNLLFGPVIDWLGPTPVMLAGAASAVVLAWFCDVRHRSGVWLRDQHPATTGDDQTLGHAAQTDRQAGLYDNGIAAGE